MATVALPLIVTGVAALLPVLPGIVQAIQAAFGQSTGDKALGQIKLETAVAAAAAVAAKLAAAGKISGIPDPTMLTTMVETEVQRSKASGTLPDAIPATVPPIICVLLQGTPAAWIEKLLTGKL